MRRLAMIMALGSALSLGLNVPAHAENAAKKRAPANGPDTESQLEQLKKKLSEKLRAAETERIRITDGKGRAVTPQELFSHPEAFRDGLHVVLGDDKLEMRGELLQKGKDGIKLYLTHIGSDQRIINGQVITISPGMTKLAVQKRFEDALESLMLFKDRWVLKSGAEKRSVASGGSASIDSVGCFLTFAMAASSLALVVAGARAPGNLIPTAMVAMVTAAVAYVVGQETCFGNDGDVFKNP